MPVSEARLAANRANALRSCGPRTPEGKAASRRNALKHGMAGQGVVTPADDSAEVGRRAGAMLREMAPRTEMGKYLVGRLAELTVRVERCARQERAAVEAQAAHAESAFDEARLAGVDHALSWIRSEPATHARALRSTPEGVDRVVAELLELRRELDEYRAARWDWTHGDWLLTLMGRRWMDCPVHPARALSEAAEGRFDHLLPADGEGLGDVARRDWARQRLIGLIDEEVGSLLAHRATLDLESIEADRAGASDRALFDPSRAATLARRYEAAAERAVYRALRELREVEASAQVPPEPEEAEPLGSSGARDTEGPVDDPEPDARCPRSPDLAPRGPRRLLDPASGRPPGRPSSRVPARLGAS